MFFILVDVYYNTSGEKEHFHHKHVTTMEHNENQLSFCGPGSEVDLVVVFCGALVYSGSFISFLSHLLEGADCHASFAESTRNYKISLAYILVSWALGFKGSPVLFPGFPNQFGGFRLLTLKLILCALNKNADVVGIQKEI